MPCESITTIPRSRTIFAAPFTRCPRCGRRHRSWYALAECLWPRVAWVQGDPPARRPCFALVSNCSPARTVTLWPSLAAAEQSKAMIDRLACGGCCRRDHAIYLLCERPGRST
jgi:hypothetical protein